MTTNLNTDSNTSTSSPATDKMTTLDLAISAEIEGLGYLIQDYVSSEDILDVELASMFEQAATLMDKIQTILWAELDRENNPNEN